MFHWSGAEQRFEVVKVNGADRENYETRADTRLFEGLVRFILLVQSISTHILVYSL